MSWENTRCPCGGTKDRDTMLCTACEQAVAGSFDFTRMHDTTAHLSERRSAAVRVLAAARRRNNLSLPLAYSA